MSFPQTLFVETTTRCNLACAMCARCQPGWAGGLGDMDMAVFERLEPGLRHARAVVLNGMGEPLLHPELARMVARVKELQPAGGWCGLQTNGRLLDAARAWELASAGLDVLCVSHDGEAAALGHGAEDGLARAAEAARTAGGRMRLGVETVLMRGNVQDLPYLVDRAASLGLDFVLASHLLPMDADSEAEGLFVPCSAAALRIFSRFQAEARSRGLSLAAVPRAAVMYNRSPQEQELMDLLRRMQESAQAEGVWLNTGRLAEVDAEHLHEVAAVFEEARNRAVEAGITLRLPALTAPERPSLRRCAFVEQDAAFIDWQGQVSPCHFLWHGYNCRVLGDPKRVEPRHFGDIREASLEAIWNGPEMARFRLAAQAGEYPACGDCGAGLCSDASGVSGPFEQDCLGVSVPCGHCPWAVGQLLCLGV